MFTLSQEALSAVDAKSCAQWIAFAPFAFYTATLLRDTGLLATLAAGGREGVELEALAERAELSPYAVSVLVDYGADLGLVSRREDGRLCLGKVGHFVVNDEMTRVNMNFTRDVCYHALPFLEQSLREGRPAGLQTLGPWATLYEGLTKMPEPAGSSWFAFDHFYSDRVFDALLPIVFEKPVRELLDVGANTGRWTLKCLRYDPQVRVTLTDLPPQLKVARENVVRAGFGERVNYWPTDLLDPALPLYAGADAITMSQFLDCFCEDEIRSILRRAAASMGADSSLYIVELFPDRQDYAAASASLNATSLYFTCIANGNSRMYDYRRFARLVADAGLRIDREIDRIGVGHTVLCCSRA